MVMAQSRHTANANRWAALAQQKAKVIRVLYKLEFEVVPAVGKGSQFYYGDNPVCRPEFVPDEFWVKTSRETDNPWQQYNTLKQWAETGTQLIRNVKLFEMSGNPQWVESRPTPRALDGAKATKK